MQVEIFNTLTRDTRSQSPAVHFFFDQIHCLGGFSTTEIKKPMEEDGTDLPLQAYLAHKEAIVNGDLSAFLAFKALRQMNEDPSLVGTPLNTPEEVDRARVRFTFDRRWQYLTGSNLRWPQDMEPYLFTINRLFVHPEFCPDPKDGLSA